MPTQLTVGEAARASLLKGMELVDGRAACLIDPAHGPRAALRNAPSTASLLLPTEAPITDLPEKAVVVTPSHATRRVTKLCGRAPDGEFAPKPRPTLTRRSSRPSTGATLVIHPGALGDVLLAIPALIALRDLGGGTRVTFAGQARLGQFLAGTGVVESSLSFDGLGLETLLGCDSIPPAVQSRLARCERVVSWFGARAEPYPERLRAIVREAVVAPSVPPHGSSLCVWEYLIETVGRRGVTAPAALLPLRLPDAWRAEARLILSRLGIDTARPVLVVHPGAGGETKRWTACGFARVIRRVVSESGCQIVLHQGPADRAAAEELLSISGNLPLLRVVDPSLPLLAAILQEADVYLGADSGVSHLAAAVGAPAIILFPPATRDRWTPWSPTALPLPMPGESDEIAKVAEAVTERVWSAVRQTAIAPLTREGKAMFGGRSDEMALRVVPRTFSSRSARATRQPRMPDEMPREDDRSGQPPPRRHEGRG